MNTEDDACQKNGFLEVLRWLHQVKPTINLSSNSEHVIRIALPIQLRHALNAAECIHDDTDLESDSDFDSDTDFDSDSDED